MELGSREAAGPEFDSDMQMQNGNAHRVQGKTCIGLGPRDPPSLISDGKGEHNRTTDAKNKNSPPHTKSSEISENKILEKFPKTNFTKKHRAQNICRIRLWNGCKVRGTLVWGQTGTRIPTSPPPPLLKFRKISKKPKFAANTKSAAYAKSAARDREADAKCGAHSCEGMPVRNTPVAQGTPKYPHQIQKRASGRTPKNLTIKRKNRRLPKLKLEITSQWPTAPPPPPTGPPTVPPISASSPKVFSASPPFKSARARIF